MSLLPKRHPLRFATRGAAGLMELASLVATAAAVIAFAWGANHLLGRSQAYLGNAGGMPEMSLDYAWQVARSPGLHLRLLWWSLSWVAAVFAAGCALMAVAGARSLYWRVHGLVRAV